MIKELNQELYRKLKEQVRIQWSRIPISDGDPAFKTFDHENDYDTEDANHIAISDLFTKDEIILLINRGLFAILWNIRRDER